MGPPAAAASAELNAEGPVTVPGHEDTGVGHCRHCGAPIERGVGEYCCRGCELAAAIISDAGLDRYYQQRDSYAPRPEPVQGSWDGVPAVHHDDGSCEVRFAVDGLRCASCVWVSERVLQSTPGVLDAHISYANGRGTVRWDPTAIGLGAIAGRIGALGYRPRVLGEEAKPDRGLLVRLGVATFAALNIMLLSAALYAGWLDGMEPRFVALFQWTSLLLATPVAIWCADPFFRGAFSGLRAGVLHMDVPIALAVAVLYAHGLVGTWVGIDTYLDSLAMLVALLLAGRVWESHGRRRAAEAAVTLAAVVPARARRERDGRLETVPADALEPGDIIQLGAGEEIAADGTVVSGSGSVRMALVTGESDPVRVEHGDAVVAGTLLEDGDVRARVDAVGAETVVQRMAEQLRAAADRQSRPSSADRIAPWFTAVTLVVATGTFVVWLQVAGLDSALRSAVAVLVVACPCALALARPLAAAAGLGAAARRGLLMRSADALLDLATVDVCGIDKTGTLTRGARTVLDADDAVLRVAAGLERASIHPVARAITAEAARRGIPLPPSRDVREVAGVGVQGIVDGKPWSIQSDGTGRVVLLGEAGRVGTIELGDPVRPDTQRAIARLEQRGLPVTLLTGDHAEAAGRVTSDTGIRDHEAELSPSDKADWIRARRRAGGTVLFVGDGLNDGPALAAADVGIAMGGGAASSVLVADGVLASDSLGPLEAGRAAARAAERAIRLGQIRSIVYNVTAVTAAALGWVNPLVAAVLMPLSSGMVLWGAGRVEGAVRAELAERSAPHAGGASRLHPTSPVEGTAA